MEVLIKIPDKYVSEDKSIYEMLLSMGKDKVKGAVKLLPKGHGKLIDATILRRGFVVSARFHGTWNLGKTRILSHIDDATAIIEADKEREEPEQTLKNCRNCGYPYKLAGKCYSCDDYSQWIPIEADKEME